MKTSHMTKTRRKSQRGVTLIEMLVVVTIIGLIATLVAVNVFKQAEGAKRKLAHTDINTFINALNLYRLDTGTFPSTELGLQALRLKPEGVINWAGPYLQKDVPLDQWNRPFQYKYPGEHGDEPDIVSLGADGQPGGEGDNADIVSWNNK